MRHVDGRALLRCDLHRGRWALDAARGPFLCRQKVVRPRSKCKRYTTVTLLLHCCYTTVTRRMKKRVAAPLTARDARVGTVEMPPAPGERSEVRLKL